MKMEYYDDYVTIIEFVIYFFNKSLTDAVDLIIEKCNVNKSFVRK